jgi:serine/threonine protein phosphatase 1
MSNLIDIDRRRRILEGILYPIGDVHGCRDQLLELMDQCRAHARGRQATFLLLGDYLDRGPDSKGVVDLLMNWNEPEELVCLKGNHEHMLEAALINPERNASAWLKNGGQNTLWSYGVMYPHQLPHDLSDWIAAMPTYFDDGEHFFVHAGVDPSVPLAEQSDRTMMYHRHPYPDEIDMGRYIVHGHTVIDGFPRPGLNHINLDTGACAGGALSAAAFELGTRTPLAIISDGITLEMDGLTAKRL